jgi:gamma-tubulin complex component 3
VDVSVYIRLTRTFRLPDTALKYSDIVGLERSIDAAYSVASQRLFDVFLEKFKLLDHLRALKQYLLLGHGDFADQLMVALGCMPFLHE